jgi:hypothetical protein
MQIPTLKIDKSLPHHYLIGVAAKPMTCKNVGEIFLKYGPLYYNNDDVKRMSNVVARSTDKIYVQSQLEAAEAENCTELISSISAMKISCHANECTIHHFSSAEELDDDDFVLLVKLANTDKSSRKKLEEARI